MPRKRHTDNWRQWIRDLMRREETIQRELPQAVRLAREQGATWTEIGAELHISQQAAHQRYREVDG